MSPYLFLLCAEGLSSILNYSNLQGVIVNVARGGCRINHLLFANDCVSFGRATMEESNKIQAMLQVYERASGQVLNKEKSAIFFNSNTKMSDQTSIRHVGGSMMVGW